MATAKVDQGGNKSNNVYSLPSRISKLSDKISQKINPKKSSKDFDVQNPERSSATEPPRTATHGHKFPATRGILIQICVNLRRILQKKMPPLDPSAHDLQNLKIASPKTALHAATDPRWPTAKPLKIVQICSQF